MVQSRSPFNYIIALVAVVALFVLSVSAAPAGSSGPVEVEGSAVRIRSIGVEPEMTNAERFAAGLPPAKPRHIKDPTSKF